MTRSATLPLGLTIEQNATIQPAGVSERCRSSPTLPTPIATSVVGANLKHEEIEALATPRTLEGIAKLSPGVTENSPNARQMVVNGAFAFDNIFMVNGVDVNDNLFAQPQNLFIEDAIEETQVLTSGISAEYGRFTGGVVNAITKSGGNTFSGSGARELPEPAWTTRRRSKCQQGHAGHRRIPTSCRNATRGRFGGPIVKDRLWFFSSGRYAEREHAAVRCRRPACRCRRTNQNKRGELKLTGTVAPGHTIQGGYLNNPTNADQQLGAFSRLIIDPHSEVELAASPN